MSKSLFLLVFAALAIVAVACSETTDTVSPTPTFSPADATATWEAFKPERDRMAAEILERQSESATVVAATQLAMDVGGDADLEVTADPTSTATNSLPERAIATGPVNRVAFDDGKGSIFTVDPDGNELANIATGSTTEGEFRFTFPVWSPDGGTVSFSSFLIADQSVTQSAVHRADADGEGEIVTIAVDPTSQSGIGPGIPHFSTWSPLGDRIALTTSGEFGIGSMLLGSYSGEFPKGLAVGAPLYINWAPDGSSILIHQDAGLHLVAVDGAESGSPVAIGVGSTAYNSPAWAPDSSKFAHVEDVDGEPIVVVTQVGDLETQKAIATGSDRVALGWSPSGEKIAISRASGEAFHTLSIYDLDSESERVIYEGKTRSFWWSPDSTKLAVMDDSDEIELAHKWLVIEVESGDVTELATQVASDQFLFTQVFFDQYADSHNIWSPDSTSVVISGAVLDPAELLGSNGSVELPEEFDSRIWVLDVTGASEPLSIGEGTIASWSPQ